MDSVESASRAISAGDGQVRLEVCSALSEGGLTPTVGLMKRIKAIAPETQAFALIRPRGGDFLYSVRVAFDINFISSDPDFPVSYL